MKALRPIHTQERARRRLPARSLTTRRIRAVKVKPPLAYITRHLEGGIEQAMTYLKVSEDETIQAMVAAYEHEAPKERRATHIETWAEQFAIPSSRIVSELSRIVYELGHDAGKFIAGVHAPGIMEASVQLAREVSARGTQERRLHFQASGFTPTYAGVTIKNQQLTVQNNRPDSEATGLPDFLSEQRQLSARLRGDVIEAEPVKD